MLKIAIVGTAVVGALYGASLLGSPYPPPEVLTLGQRAKRFCGHLEASSRQACEAKILLRPAYERAAREVQHENR